MKLVVFALILVHALAVTPKSSTSTLLRRETANAYWPALSQLATGYPTLATVTVLVIFVLGLLCVQSKVYAVVRRRMSLSPGQVEILIKSSRTESFKTKRLY
mmetsp:Transcript_10641/g.20590  ORF Transcript_10641/g.20590 Transcript_10641/m.20590 type:complete len:102 (-) Transcript_10641:3429-3734(-)